MSEIDEMESQEIARALAYAGFVLVGYELVKSMIVKPIKSFYKNVTFGEGMPFKSYEHDVLSRHKNEFEACLLYLQDFMEALEPEDVEVIQSFRRHRNEVTHDLVPRLQSTSLNQYHVLIEKVDRTLFKLSNYRVRMEIGADPVFKDKGIDWETAKGHEYILFERVKQNVADL